MPEFEAIGEAVTAGMLGRAVEPKAGETAEDRTHETNCLNCGAPLTGPFCANCGQHAHVHRTIAAWWHDFLHSVLHLDGKFWRTLPMLAWRPGELTRRYAHGERAKFISPLALFLFTVFLMFAVFSFAGRDIGDGLGFSQSVEQGLKEERDKLQRLQRERQEAVQEADTAEVAELDGRLSGTRDEIAQLERLRDEGVTSIVLSDNEPDVGGDSWFGRAYRKAKENPELLIYKVQANAYKFSWALIPISVPFVWVLFVHRRRYRQEFTAYDHLVFVTYSIAFMSMALVTFVLLSLIGAPKDLLDLAFVLIPPVHMYRQLKGAYGLSRFSALWRTLALLIFASIALSLFGMLLLLLGALG
jgi:hypothetical protein